MVTAINGSTFVKDTTIQLRNQLRDNITDPISGTRPTGQKFILTTYPDESTVYPVITLQVTDINANSALGMQSVLHNTALPIEIRVWSQKVSQKDSLTQDVLNELRSIQHTITTGTVQAGLFDFKMLSAVNVDEPGQDGIKSKVMTVQYSYILGQ